MLKKYSKTDTNVRVNENEVSVCPKIDEVKLEEDVLEAVNLWNQMHLFPKLGEEINEIRQRHLGKRIRK